MTTSPDTEDKKYRHKQTGTIYKRIKPGHGGMVRVTTEAGSQYITEMKNIEPIPMSDTDDTLLHDIHLILSTSLRLDKTPIGNEWHIIGYHEVAEKLRHLISQDRVERDIDSRIDELRQAVKHISRGQRWDEYLDRAIDQMEVELKKQRKEASK